MPKGLRLKFYGTVCTRNEVRAMAFALGFNTRPNYSGWGNGMYRHYLGLTRNTRNNLFEAGESLVEKGLMEAYISSTCPGAIFKVTDSGKAWILAFKHKHPRAAL